MTDKKSYEELVNESAEIRRDLDVVLHPIFGNLKKAFKVIWGSQGFTKNDFKALSDLVYYQGGYPSPTSLPREVQLANQVAAALKLQDSFGRSNLEKLLQDRGISISFEHPEFPTTFLKGLNDKESSELKEGWEGGGIDHEIPDDRFEALKLLVDKAQKLQREICQQADAIKVDAAEVVEDLFKIKKSNFMKAVGLATVKLKRGDGVMAEKVDDVHDQIANLEQAIAPFNPK